ncbi:MAG: NAD(P)H-binding protein [Microbacterium sp.]
MDVTVFGGTGPTGRLVCEQAAQAGHSVRAVTRRAGPVDIPGNASVRVVRADAQSGEGVEEAVTGADAVVSALGTAYSRHEITVYSEGVRHIVDGIRSEGRGRRLIVVSSGLTYPPAPMNWFADRVLFPLLRDVIGRTLYADMRRMEEYLHTCPDIEWTVMRPGRLFDSDRVSDYRIDLDHPSGGYTARADLAAAIVAELTSDEHLRQAVAPSTAR